MGDKKHFEATEEVVVPVKILHKNRQTYSPAYLEKFLIMDYPLDRYNVILGKGFCEKYEILTKSYLFAGFVAQQTPGDDVCSVAG